MADESPTSRGQPPTIVFVITDGRLGGTERQVERLAREMAVLGWSCEVWLLRAGGPLVDRLEESGIRHTVLGIDLRQQPARGLFSLIRAGWKLKRTAPDVLFPFLAENLAIILGLARMFSRSSVRVAGVRGFTPYLGVIVEQILRSSLRRADLVICNARHLATEMVERFELDPDHVKVIPNGVDASTPTARKTMDTVSAVVISNFLPYKGHATLLKALRVLPAQLEVRLCGRGNLREELVRQANSLGLAGSVTFVDEPIDVAEELSRAHFAIHPSHTEGLSNAILEEMAAGLPVVACRVGGNIDLITHQVNGLLVPVGDVAALSRAILQLLDDRTLRERLGKGARDKALQYSWEGCSLAYDVLLRDLVVARFGHNFASTAHLPHAGNS